VKFDGNVTIFAVLAALNRSHDAFTGLADVKPTALYTCLGACPLRGKGRLWSLRRARGSAIRTEAAAGM